MSAEDLGKRLLAEVGEVGFDEILNTPRLQDGFEQSYFDLPQLDTLLRTMTEAQRLTSRIQGAAPIIEIMSQRPGSGKTQLLYHLIATAVLPFHLGGRQAAVVFIDADKHFSVTRLAQQMRKAIVTHTKKDPIDATDLDETLIDSLKHVHVLYPQTLAATIATLNSLPAYLFDPTKHHSFDRALNFIALDSASAFYWQARADAEDAALQASFRPEEARPRQPPTRYVQLAGALKNASKILSAPVIFTSRGHNPRPKNCNNASSNILGLPDAQSIRPSLPPPWPSLSTLRLVVRRAPVRSLAHGLSLEEIVRETAMRQPVIDRGKFECFVNIWGVDEQTVQKLRTRSCMLEFFVTDDGVKVGDGPE